MTVTQDTSSEKSTPTRPPIVTMEPQVIIQPPEMSTFHSLFMGYNKAAESVKSGWYWRGEGAAMDSLSHERNSGAQVEISEVSYDTQQVDAIFRIENSKPLIHGAIYNERRNEKVTDIQIPSLSSSPSSSSSSLPSPISNCAEIVPKGGLDQSFQYSSRSTSYGELRKEGSLPNENPSSSYYDRPKSFQIKPKHIHHYQNHSRQLSEFNKEHKLDRTSELGVEHGDGEQSEVENDQIQNSIEASSSISSPQRRDSRSFMTDNYNREKRSTTHCSDFTSDKIMKTSRQRSDRDRRYNHGRWTAAEHEAFVKAFKICGRDWSRIAREFVRTRMRSQVASHAQKYLMKIEGGDTESETLMTYQDDNVDEEGALSPRRESPCSPILGTPSSDTD